MSDEDEVYQENGLEKYYDVVILGTGLVQSILSCVASKHGKKVLHLDKNDFYGEVYASHNLSTHLSHYESKRVDLHGQADSNVPEELVSGFGLNNEFDDVYVAYFRDNVSKHKTSAKPRRPNKCEIYHPACYGYSMERETVEASTNPTEAHPVFHNYVKHNKLTCARVWNKDRDFNIDTTSKVLFGSSPMVDLMITSGVGNYLEFKSFEGLYFMMEDGQDRIWKVPCSRNDVFNTTMLGALEKRSLMKFHQFVADWGRVNCGTEVTSLNENELAIGRSLYRPQNKQLISSGYNVEAFVDKPFKDFLTDCKISPKLQSIIIYALCCHEAPMHKSGHSLSKEYLTRDALNDMYMHIDSIGRFGETAFLTPLYGASEVVQAFCRMSAVWGGTFILQRSVRSIEVMAPPETGPCIRSNNGFEDAVSTETGAGNTKFCCDGLVVTDTSGSKINCSAFVCGAAYWPKAPTRDALKVSCTSVWLGTIVPLPRSIIIIPPSHEAVGQIGNSHAVHIIQTDSSTNSAPEGVVVLHMSTILEFEAGNGPRPQWRESAALQAENARVLMDRVIGKLVESFSSSSSGSAADELSRVVTLQPVYDASGEIGLPDGVHLCAESSSASLSMQSAYEEALRIFRRLYPDKDFSLNIVEDIPSDAHLYHNADGEIDDEATYLEHTLHSAGKCNHADFLDASN